MADKVNIRIPVIENLAAQYGGAFSGNSRGLNPQERSVAISIFMQSINYDAVRIVTATVAAAPTTLGNHIRILPGYNLDNETLIHELTHIWQFQTKGNSYISNSLIHQTVCIITGGDRNGAYTYTIVPGQSINRYTAEQQAMIVQDYFSSPALRNNPEYIRMMGEVRSARPVLTDMDRYQESLYGVQYQNNHFFDPIPGSNDRRTETVTILRVEF
ncbi:MAG: hypothetical protein NVS3B8_14280 [Chitinophagaceae bacterium]